MVAAHGLGAEPLLQGLVEPFDLAAGLGMVGPGMTHADAAQPALHLQRNPALTSLFTGEHRARMSVSTSAGAPQWPIAARNTCHTWVPVKIRRAIEAMQTREWSSRMLKISTSVPSASRQWVMSACQRSLGWSAQNVFHDDRGRFCGCGVTNPRRVRIRQIVETAGTGSTPAAWQVGGDRLRAGVQALLGESLAEPDDLVLDLQV